MADVHAHHAEDRNAYYLDQLFMIGICGALAGVTLLLWLRGDLPNLVHPKFFVWIILGAIGLVILIGLRAAAVWRSVDETSEPSHAHGPCCDHGPSHEEGIHASGGGTASLAVAPAVGHGHSHSHGHGHSHNHGDHDHGIQPWRYVILLIPVALYIFVLAQKNFSLDLKSEATDPASRINTWIVDFSSTVWQALPFVFIGSVIAGLLDVLLPQRVLVALLPRSRGLAIGMGCLLGLIFPMCECGIIPIMRRLLRKGLPLSVCVAYLLAGPIINVIVLVSTFAAFSGMEDARMNGDPLYQMGGWWMLAFRSGMGFVVAYVTAVIVEWQFRRHGDSLLMPLARTADRETEGERLSLRQKVDRVSETAMHDFVDITVFLIIGTMLAATSAQFFSKETVHQLSGDHALLTIALMMGLAIVLCLCSEIDAFVAASYVSMAPSAKLAFLVLGPMLDFKLYAMYTRIFRPRLILAIYVPVVVQVFAYSAAVHYFWETYKTALVRPKPVRTMSDEDIHTMAVKTTQVVGLMAPPAPGGSIPVNVMTTWGQLLFDASTKSMEMSFLRLEAASQSVETRHFFQGRRILLVGKFAGNEDQFMLLRYKINCCAADATPLRVPFVLDANYQGKSLPVNDLRNKWVQVIGRIAFQPRGGSYQTVVVITPRDDEPLSKLVEVVPQPANPYIY